jgi:hypothetical protein
MLDSLRHGAGTPLADSAEHDDKTEQLLVVGLDHYFAGEFDHAINVWTRILFLDRGHARARAYIERARSALAERQRESDELLNEGVDAYRRGDLERARQLLLGAVDRGGASEEALTALARIERLHTPPAGARRSPRPSPESLRRGGYDRPERSGGPRVRLVPVVVLLTMTMGAIFVAIAWPVVDPLVGLRPTIPAAVTTPVVEDALPLPSPAELAVGRAQALFRRGHLHEALRVLDDLRTGGGLDLEIDRLRADIQRTLLSGRAPQSLDRPAPGLPSGPGIR